MTEIRNQHQSKTDKVTFYTVLGNKVSMFSILQGIAEHVLFNL